MDTAAPHTVIERPGHDPDRVVHDVLELRARRDYQPLKLRPALENLHRTHRANDAQALDHALQELVVAALATMERIRGACPEVGGSLLA